MAIEAPRAIARPGAPERPREAVRAADVSPRQERLLSEISHELGNYFHKLYYWAELLREQRSATADVEPAVLLEQTIRDLETFLKTALEFFRPISVVPMAMSVHDVTQSLRALITRHADPAPVEWHVAEPASAATVSVDPGRFSFVLDGLVRRLHVGPSGAVSASVEVHQTAGDASYVLTLVGRGVEGGASASVMATIEWAVIERLVELHGGTVEASATALERTVRLRLPIQS